MEASEFEDAGVLDGCSVVLIQMESLPLSVRSTTGLAPRTRLQEVEVSGGVLLRMLLVNGGV